MKAQRPRRTKPLLFSLLIHSREATIIDVKDQPIAQWQETIELLNHKGVLPGKTPKQNILDMIEKRL